ncbi:hypothetical protein OF829_07740 [Sphingomonas sp. LB-2]|uniref:hypothetical protein n=1 Tax=Sphingomonas caeni TaxID=2984949 RepID=UPI00222FE0E6|nr:hypothetical protein [Sphingomonas caeni]MCW3847128.1 hypothetical protein [Sphingomonas caeni]
MAGIVGAGAGLLSAGIAYYALKAGGEATVSDTGKDEPPALTREQEPWPSPTPLASQTPKSIPIPAAQPSTPQPQPEAQPSPTPESEPARQLPERIADRSKGCPARQIAVRFERPGNVSGAFEGITESLLVVMYDCDQESGDFSTLFSRGTGSLTGTGGRLQSGRLTFDFGHHSSSIYGEIRCSVSAQKGDDGDFHGSMSCGATYHGYVMNIPEGVEIRL